MSTSLSVFALLAIVSAASAQLTTASSMGAAPVPATTAAPAATAKPKANGPTYSMTYTPGVNLPHTSEQGQTGYNDCGTGSNSTSMCQNLYINSVDDFCVFGPPYSGPQAAIGDTERIEIAYCTKSGYGTRVMPDGTLTGAHFVKTPDYVQVTGWGDFTKIGIPQGDFGGELDPHGYDGLGNPIGGLVFGNSYGEMQQYHEWTNFMSFNQFCIRACNPDGPNPAGFCEHIYDLQGCNWNMPGNYDNGYFEDCLGDSSLPMGVYGTSTWHQGDGATPPAHPAPSSSSCVRVASVTSGEIAPTSDSFSSVFTTSSAGSSVITFLESVATLTGGAGAANPAAPTGTAASNTGTASGSSGSSSSSSSHSGAQGLGSVPFLTVAVMGFGAMVGMLVAL